MREIVIRGLGRTNPEAFKFVLKKFYFNYLCFVFALKRFIGRFNSSYKRCNGS